MASPTAPPPTSTVRTPIWRRITAAFGLGTIVILVGLILGALITVSALMAVFLLEHAIS